VPRRHRGKLIGLLCLGLIVLGFVLIKAPTPIISIAAEPINERADAMAARLKAGVNEVFTRMEVSGHAYGVASMIHFTLADGDFDREFGSDVNRRIKVAAGSAAATGIKRALQNHGVDILGRVAFRVSATHNEADIDATLAAFEATLAEVRAEGLV